MYSSQFLQQGIYKSIVDSMILCIKALYAFSVLSNFAIYQACGVDDGLYCFGNQTKILYKISILSSFLMNLTVFQDYLARFLKKWKRRNTIEPSITTNNSCVDLPKIENHIRYIGSLCLRYEQDEVF